MKYCDQCGVAVSPESKFCSQYGARLKDSPPPVPSVPPSLETTTGRNIWIR